MAFILQREKTYSLNLHRKRLALSVVSVSASKHLIYRWKETNWSVPWKRNNRKYNQADNKAEISQILTFKRKNNINGKLENSKISKFHYLYSKLNISKPHVSKKSKLIKHTDVNHFLYICIYVCIYKVYLKGRLKV